MQDKREPFERHEEEPAQAAARAQDSVGWTNMFEGKTSKLWRKRQEQWCAEIGSRKTARVWAKGFVQQLPEMTHRLWLKRCSIRHNRAEGEGTETDVGDHEERIKEQHVLGTDGLASEHHALTNDEPLEKALKCRPIDQEAWTKEVLLARKEETEQCTGEEGCMQATMSRWINTGEDENRQTLSTSSGCGFNHWGTWVVSSSMTHHDNPLCGRAELF